MGCSIDAVLILLKYEDVAGDAVRQAKHRTPIIARQEHPNFGISDIPVRNHACSNVYFGCHIHTKTVAFSVYFASLSAHDNQNPSLASRTNTAEFVDIFVGSLLITA